MSDLAQGALLVPCNRSRQAVDLPRGFHQPCGSQGARDHSVDIHGHAWHLWEFRSCFYLFVQDLAFQDLALQNSALCNLSLAESFRGLAAAILGGNACRILGLGSRRTPREIKKFGDVV